MHLCVQLYTSKGMRGRAHGRLHILYVGDDPVNSMYGYPGFDEISVMIFIYGDPGDDIQLHIWRDTYVDGQVSPNKYGR